MNQPLLTVKCLRVGFQKAEGGYVEAVRGIDLTVSPGEAVGVVGESGSGKSLTMLALMRLITPPGRILGGSAMLSSADGAGVDLMTAGESAMRRLRGREIAMVFQDPQSSLNPALTIGRQIVDVIRAHREVENSEARAIAIEALDRVGITNAKARLSSYPHEFSGGMRQRALIAMAVACRPRLLIADEPTTALDVTVQAQIVKLLNELRRDLGLSVVFISHNLELIGEIVDRVVVMYGGKVVENGGVDAIETKPRHPYTRLLKACVPRIDGPIGPLTAIEGAPPRLGHMPQGCPFAPRCQVNLPVCGETMPPLARDQDRLVACWNPQ